MKDRKGAWDAIGKLKQNRMGILKTTLIFSLYNKQSKKSIVNAIQIKCYEASEQYACGLNEWKAAENLVYYLIKEKLRKEHIC